MDLTQCKDGRCTGRLQTPKHYPHNSRGHLAQCDEAGGVGKVVVGDAHAHVGDGQPQEAPDTKHLAKMQADSIGVAHR